MSSAASASPATSPRPRRPMTTTTDEMIYAKPASVHFGGFVPDKTVQQRIRVHNNSAKAVRLRYLFPTGKKGFRATFASADRSSFVSAGLSEEIIVSFTPPAGFQYYYDCIQVQSEEVAYGSSTDVTRGGATLIPLHAYPTVNEVTFPTRMDFGNVPRGSCTKKYVDISCSVPVEFEYQLRVTKAHPAFTIFPLTGTIPPNGEARIELEFRPVIYATANAELELHVSQLGFTPRTCTLAGSSSSTAVDTASAAEVRVRKSDSTASPTLERRRPEAQSKTSKPRASSGQAKSFSKKYEQEEPQYGNDEVELEKVRGIEIPHDLNSVTGISFVLNQEPGKLKPKDLKKAIAANHALRQQQREEQAKLNTGNVSCGENEDVTALSFQTLVREEQGFLDRVRVSKQVKDMFFQQELREVEEAEKALEFQSHKVHLGQRLISPEQISRLVTLRELNFQALTQQQRVQLRTMFINVYYDPPIVSDRQRPLNNDNQPLMLGELKTAVLPAKFVPAYAPDFKVYRNDLWARRQRVLRRLVRAVSTCILRLRVQKRLRRIQAWIGDAKTRAQVREKVYLDWQSIDESDDDSAVITNTENTEALIQSTNLEVLDSVSTNSFPLVEESTTQKRREYIEIPADWGLKFNSFTFMELKPRSEALLMGHEQLLLPALPTHVPLEHDRILRQGAEGECGVVASLLSPAASVMADTGRSLAVKTPSLLEMVPSDVFLRPQASVLPLMKLQRPRETEPSYTLRPRRIFRTPPSIPPLAERAQDVSSLSDSESDDEGENSGADISWKHARDLFEGFTQEDGGSKVYENGELLGHDMGVYSFERYRHLIRQERSYNSHRQELLERLPKVGAVP
eukprot:jgi/Phyca11/116869/e_gw1.31.214.1